MNRTSGAAGRRHRARGQPGQGEPVGAHDDPSDDRHGYQERGEGPTSPPPPVDPGPLEAGHRPHRNTRRQEQPGPGIDLPPGHQQRRQDRSGQEHAAPEPPRRSGPPPSRSRSDQASGQEQEQVGQRHRPQEMPHDPVHLARPEGVLEGHPCRNFDPAGGQAEPGRQQDEVRRPGRRCQTRRGLGARAIRRTVLSHCSGPISSSCRRPEASPRSGKEAGAGEETEPHLNGTAIAAALIGALGPPRRLPCRLHGGKQQGDQHRDERDDHEKLDECEPATADDRGALLQYGESNASVELVIRREF